MFNFFGFFVSILCISLVGIHVAVIIGFVFMFLNPIFAAETIKMCIQMKKWAYPNKYKDEYEEWDEAKKITLGAIWLITLSFCTIIYLFLGIIHRVFDSGN